MTAKIENYLSNLEISDEIRFFLNSFEFPTQTLSLIRDSRDIIERLIGTSVECRLEVLAWRLRINHNISEELGEKVAQWVYDNSDTELPKCSQETEDYINSLFA